MDLGKTRLPRAGPALRRLSARRGLPVARAPLRAGPPAGPVRRLVPPAARGSAPRRSSPARSRRTPRPSPRSRATGSCEVDGDAVFLPRVAAVPSGADDRRRLHRPADPALDPARAASCCSASSRCSGRIQNGRYLRPLFTLLTKVPFLKRWIEKARRRRSSGRTPSSRARCGSSSRTRSNSTIRSRRRRRCRSSRAGAGRAARDAGAAGRRAGAEATNRQMRRALEKQQKRR